MKRMKKVWALVLALVMVLALGVTNAAADETMDFWVRYQGKGKPGSGENAYNLAGGVFVLKSGTTVYTSEPSGEDGLAKFTGIPAGTYTLELSKAAIGYDQTVCDNYNDNQATSTTVTVKTGTITINGNNEDNTWTGLYAEFAGYSYQSLHQWNGGSEEANEGYYQYPCFTSKYDMYVVEVPYIKTVALGGNAAPGSMVFEVESIDGQGNVLTYAFAECSFKMETNGAGESKGKLVIKGDGTNMKATFKDGGITIREKNTGADNWTYSKAQYTIEIDANAWQKNGDVYVPTTCQLGRTVTDDGQATTEALRDVPVTFTNIYTRNASYYYNNTTTAETKGSPKTFDAGIGVYAVSALLSVTGGAWLVGKKHK